MVDIETSIGIVYLRHAPYDTEKQAVIAESMVKNGWVGRGVIMYDAGDHFIAFTGTHRLAASVGLDVDIECVMLPEDLTAEQYSMLNEANDDDELYQAIVDIAQERDDMSDVVEVMGDEIKSNKSN